MPLAEATALAALAQGALMQTRRGQGLHLELADPAADRTELVRLAQWCQRFSPTVGLEESSAPESLLLDITGLAPLVGGESALAAEIVQAFAARGLAARVAVADTPDAAWALAHDAPLQIESDDQFDDAPGDAKILSALAVPILAPAGKTAAALAELPLAALALAPEVESLLAQLGLQRIGQLAALPRSTLRARFGPALLDKLDRAHGLAPAAIVAEAAPVEYQCERLLEHPTARGEMIEHVLGQLIEQTCEMLARQRRGVLRLECVFSFEGRPAASLVVGMYRPSANARHVRELVALQLESRRFGAPVAAIALRVLAYDTLEFHQQQMFEAASAGAAPRELALLVDRLSNRLGSHAVLRPWLLASAQPEFACQYRPLASLASRRKRSAARQRRNVPGKKAAAPPAVTPPSEKPPGDRPLRLEPRPRRLVAVSVAPEGPPVKFRLAAGEQQVARYWGPERIETSWWRGRCVRRDYYQVETAAGDRYWLFRELSSGRWFLHGSFA